MLRRRKETRACGLLATAGAPVALPGKHVPHFKPGKELRERVNGTQD